MGTYVQRVNSDYNEESKQSDNDNQQEVHTASHQQAEDRRKKAIKLLMSRESSFNVIGYKSENEQSEAGDETPKSLEDPTVFTNIIKAGNRGSK